MTRQTRPRRSAAAPAPASDAETTAIDATASGDGSTSGEPGPEAPAAAFDGAAPAEPEAPTTAIDGAAPTEAQAPTTAEPDERPESATGRRARPKLSVGKTPGVAADDTLAEAGRKVLRFHFARMLAREAGTREGTDPEELHAMRVATRRMRAAWRVFGDGFRPGRTRRLRRPLREIAGRLGAVRDLDVLIDAAEATRAAIGSADSRAMEPLLAGWRVDREAARTLLVRDLDANSYARFVEEFRVFVVTEGAGAAIVPVTSPHRVRDAMPPRIWTAYSEVRAYEPLLRWADIETLHELRIAAKRLRYTLEFVRDALGDGVGPLIIRTVALQDHLGLMHDADVSANLARRFLVEGAGRLSPRESAAIGRYLVDREREAERLRRTVGRPWAGVSGPAFRRTLGRVVAGL